ncbi:MAG: alpha/beta hydrolase [Pseudomonadota bacterium]
MTSIVLIPGMDGTGALFADFIAALGPGIDPIVVSYPVNQALDYAALEAIAGAALPTDRPYILLGESFSGPVAISLAASHPAGLMGLILVGSFARSPLPALRPFKKLIDVLPISQKLTWLLAPFLFGRFSSSRLRRDLHGALSRLSSATLRARLHAVLDVDFSQKLQQISQPVLYLLASNDRIVPASCSRQLQSLKPEVEIIAFDAPHLLLQAVPVHAAKAVQKFIHAAEKRAIAAAIDLAIKQ